MGVYGLTRIDIRNELTPIFYDSDDSSLTSSQDMSLSNMLFQGSVLSMQQRRMIPSSMRGEPTLGEDLPEDIT
jgi:hypothetical protein